jgi:uncharacterized repeat protein (TIGR02543 family)
MKKVRGFSMVIVTALLASVLLSGCSGYFSDASAASSAAASTRRPVPASTVYTIRFLDSEDEQISYGTLTYLDNGEVPALPEDPVKEDYSFTGWYTSPDCQEAFDIRKAQPEDTAYAGWQELPYVHNLTKTLPNYTFISQMHPVKVRMGCEVAALFTALKSTGHALDVTYKEALALVPKTDTDNPYLGFCGSLYEDTWMRDAVMPNILAEWGAQYGNTADISKQGLSPVLQAIYNNHPVLVWTSIHFQASETVWDDTQTGVGDDAVDPLTGQTLNWFGSTGSHWEYKTNNHVMVLMGYNERTRSFLVADPAEWKGSTYWVSYETFMASWDCYQGAVEVW